MSRSILKKSLSTILTATVFIQFTLGSTLALGQTNNINPLAPNDPFWSNTPIGSQINPTSSNFWFNNPGDPTNPSSPSSNDPWGNWSDNGSGWNGSGGLNSGWGDPNSGMDYMGGYGSGFGAGGYGLNVRPTDPLWLTLMRYTGIVDKSYSKRISDLRAQYGAYGDEDNDAIADKIIWQDTRMTGALAAGAAVISRGLNMVWADRLTTGSAIGYGMGLVGGYLADFMAVITQEANMMYSLQELYGQLSADSDERAAESILPFLLGLSGTSITKVVSDMLLISPLPPAPVPDPGPAPIPPSPLTEAAPSVEKSLVNGAEADIKQVASEDYKEILTSRVSKGRLSKMANDLIVKTKTPRYLAHRFPNVFKDAKNAEAEWLKKLRAWPVISRVAISALISVGFNATNCYIFGKWAKMTYKAEHKANLAKAIQLMRATPRVRDVVWLILLRDIFPSLDGNVPADPLAPIDPLKKPEPLKKASDDSIMYAAIMMREFPLFRFKEKNGRVRDDLVSLLDDYKAHPKMIDTDLVELRNTMPIAAKLEIIKVLYAGVKMKGRPDSTDEDLITNVAVGLGLRPADYNKVPNMEALQERMNSAPMVHLERYNSLIKYMDLASFDADLVASGKLPQNPNYVKAKKWRSGQLILNDFEQPDVLAAAKFLADEAKHGGVIKGDKAAAQAVATKIVQASGQPPPPMTPGDDPFDFMNNPSGGATKPGTQTGAGTPAVPNGQIGTTPAGTIPVVPTQNVNKGPAKVVTPTAPIPPVPTSNPNS